MRPKLDRSYGAEGPQLRPWEHGAEPLTQHGQGQAGLGGQPPPTQGFPGIVHFTSQQPYEVGAIIVAILKMTKQRLTEIK